MDVLKARKKAKEAKKDAKAAEDAATPPVPEPVSPPAVSPPATSTDLSGKAVPLVTEPVKPPPEAPKPASPQPPAAVKTPSVSPPLPDIFRFDTPDEPPVPEAEPPAAGQLNEEEQFLHSYAAQAGRQSNSCKYLTFEVGGERYGVLLTDVRETIKLSQITEVPRSPVYLIGLISLRGVMVPVVDLRQRLALETPPLTRQSRVIICSTEGGLAGFVVDRIHKVVDVIDGDIQPPPATLSLDEQEAIEGIARYRLISQAETQAAAEAAAEQETPAAEQASTVEFFALLRIPVISRIEFSGGSR